mmetsp:Transcript_60244/g.182172  ORF Transcript_60244/g.182172 Transcript_60244/m.182172 type:complete len:323 (-) Transcript_60244:642-1610(-)
MLSHSLIGNVRKMVGRRSISRHALKPHIRWALSSVVAALPQACPEDDGLCPETLLVRLAIVVPKVSHELLPGQQGPVESFANVCLDHVSADEHDLRSPVAMAALLVLLGVRRPLGPWHRSGQPPGAWLQLSGESGRAPLDGVLVVAGRPCEALRTKHAGEVKGRQHLLQALGVERPVRAVHEAGDAVLLGLRLVAAALQLPGPPWHQARRLDVEALRVQKHRRAHLAVLALDHAGPWIELRHDAFEAAQLVGGDQVRLVEDQDVRKLRLVDQQVHDRAPVPLLSSQILSVDQLVGTTVVLHEVLAIDHGDQRVQACYASQQG